jgi:hypothetical protein
MRQSIPLRRRPLDIGLLGFFVFNLFFVSYVISLEQIAIGNPAAFVPPPWPPRGAITLVHWWEKTYDPLLWARPAWYRATIWIDVLLFGPFYAAAILAYSRGRDWIRLPSILWAGLMFANVTIILFDELLGVHASPHPWVIVGANASWFLVPVIVVWRMARRPYPFTEEVPLPTLTKPVVKS